MIWDDAKLTVTPHSEIGWQEDDSERIAEEDQRGHGRRWTWKRVQGAWRRGAGRSEREADGEHEQRWAGAGAGNTAAGGGQERGASRSTGEQGSRGAGACSITQYHVFCTLQYQTIFDDKKYLWSPI
ncbi:hypothetical protein B0H14DRAFT_2561796 [Mycena olivaceomarginata]|nr:hypothetical protein B0H14DRAFT_2561796 [Mycena olivaceomarginata]